MSTLSLVPFQTVVKITTRDPQTIRTARVQLRQAALREGSRIKQNAQATQNSLLKNVTRLRDRHFLFACGAHLVVDQAVVSDLPLGLLWWPPVDGDGSGGQGVGAQVDRRTGDMNCNTECQQLLTYNCTQNKQNKPPKSPFFFIKSDLAFRFRWWQRQATHATIFTDSVSK